MLALSVSWNAWRYAQATDIIKEIELLGFREVELSFNLTASMVDEMYALKRQGLIDVVSVHNFCPIPQGASRQKALPDIFALSAPTEGERQKAVDYTKRTIDTACRLNAKAVVLHLGRIGMDEKVCQLAQFWLAAQGTTKTNKQNRQRYIKLRTQMLKERKAKSKQSLARALKSLEQLCRYAQTQKMKLGIENRYYFSEIPSVDEMEVILATFPSPPIYYWHDVGHAQVYENLEFIKHKVGLDKFSQRMIGVHLHDIEDIDDHRAPLKGKFDFTLLKPYITADVLKVLEPHYPATAADIIRAKKYLEELFKDEQ